MSKPLFDIDSERAIVGALFLHPELLSSVREAGITKGSFFDVPCGIVFEAMTALASLERSIDQISVAGYVRTVGLYEKLGGSKILVSICEAIVTAANIETYCKIVRDLEIRRGLDLAGQKISTMAKNYDDVSAAVAGASKTLQSVANGVSANGAVQIDAVADQNTDVLFEPGDPPGLVKTHIDLIDSHSGGLWPELTVLACRPGMGKSTLALNIAINAADHGERVLLVTLEDSKRIIYWRMLARLARVPMQNLRRKIIFPDQIQRVYQTRDYIKTLPLWVEHNNSLSSQQIRDLVTSHKIKHGVDLVIIDHLAHIQEPGRLRPYERVTQACQTIARIPGDVEAPVVLVHQLNRNTLTHANADKLPTLGDLRESGEVEQLARAVWLLHRPHYYDPNADANDMQLIIAKDSNGPTGTLKLFCEMKYISIKKSIQLVQQESY